MADDSGDEGAAAGESDVVGEFDGVDGRGEEEQRQSCGLHSCDQWPGDTLVKGSVEGEHWGDVYPQGGEPLPYGTSPCTGHTIINIWFSAILDIYL